VRRQGSAAAARPRAIRTRAALACAGLLALTALQPSLAMAAARPAYGGELRVALTAPAHLADPALAETPPDLALAEALHATPLVLRPDGSLEPALLAEPPVAGADGRSYRLLLRDGLRAWDGSPLGAADLAESLARLLRPQVGSPHAWLSVAIQGADEVLAGRAATPSGLRVLSERELVVTLAFPLPEFPGALAALPAALVSAQGAGAGPFRPPAPSAPATQAWQARLEANPFGWRGRPFADALLLSAPDAHAAARALQAGELDLSLRPEATAASLAVPRPTVTYARISAGRLGAAAEVVRATLAALDRADLVHRFQRTPTEPLAALLPPPLLPPEPLPPLGAPPHAGPGAAGTRVVVMVPSGASDARALAERLQVKLFDAGLRPVLQPVEPSRFAARLAARDYDLALVQVTLLSGATALAAGQVAGAAAGPQSARRAERALAGLDGPALAAAAAALRAELELVPLGTAAGRASPGPALRGLVLRPDGSFDAGDLWRLPGSAP